MQTARLGAAGPAASSIYGQTRLGVAGINMPQLADAAHLGIASQMSSWTRRHVLPEIPGSMEGEELLRVSDALNARQWQRTLYMLQFTYLICTDREGGYRWRKGFDRLFDRQHRRMPLALDSDAFRRYSGRVKEKWGYSEAAYWAAIDIVDPDIIFPWDTIGDVQASAEAYRRFRAVYGDRVIPVWQARSAWSPRRDVVIPGRHSLTPAERVTIANAAWAARCDPYLKWMCEQSKVVAIGGMATHENIFPAAVKHLYFAELCRAFPDNQFWALGLARDTFINGIGQLGLIDRVWSDGSWWIHNARNDRIPYVEGGIIKVLDLGGMSAAEREKRRLIKREYSQKVQQLKVAIRQAERAGTSTADLEQELIRAHLHYRQVYSFASLSELMVMNLRSLAAAYSGLIEFPRPLPSPLDPMDVEQLSAIKQLMLWDFVPDRRDQSC